mmetsp:Transcript_29290/g.52969  ORF Transcript_29290/g.52969 Transcript_29290/m.52969 type:complete len:165 (+) Transcript_29290:55-549(+)|eukprot:CAMPEP_0202479826 /NCGR_PEP_ID=MMETSP1361-20130828/9_1 /ASSEMBLY_ACC=CAM_ASM_000849 /TAXON_ID=210615 /ORGANISM="Staurosira complex sp., Strain CCMP2646" /LENGTH=164 /DNA_ID=CAMNT_0049107177 /DNA_START=49 /DNA_END=543 /DNA_ORIENTATION=-
MKTAVFLVSSLAVASAFAPTQVNSRSGMELMAKKGATKEEKKPFFESVFSMDLFAPNPEVNTYGARAKKNLKLGSIGSNSYIPDGLSQAEYDKIRQNDLKKREENYKRNVAKAGKFEDFTEWYQKRGTDLNQGWIKDITRGHRMVKTKYDFSGSKDNKKVDGSL